MNPNDKFIFVYESKKDVPTENLELKMRDCKRKLPVQKVQTPHGAALIHRNGEGVRNTVYFVDPKDPLDLDSAWRFGIMLEGVVASNIENKTAAAIVMTEETYDSLVRNGYENLGDYHMMTEFVNRSASNRS